MLNFFKCFNKSLNYSNTQKTEIHLYSTHKNQTLWYIITISSIQSRNAFDVWRSRCCAPRVARRRSNTQIRKGCPKFKKKNISDDNRQVDNIDLFVLHCQVLT